MPIALKSVQSFAGSGTEMLVLNRASDTTWYANVPENEPFVRVTRWLLLMVRRALAVALCILVCPTTTT